MDATAWGILYCPSFYDDGIGTGMASNQDSTRSCIQVAWNSTITVASVAWCLSVHADRFLQTLSVWDTVCSVWSAPWLRSVVSHLAFLVAGRTEGWKCGEHGSASSAIVSKNSFIVPGLQQLIGTAST